MPAQEIQKAFWTRLKESNPELFTGTPDDAHYFDVLINGNPNLIIRLNLYLQPAKCREKGAQTIAVVVPYDKVRKIKSLYDNDCETIHDDFIVHRVSNSNINDPIPEDVLKWQPYIDWFVKYTQKLKALLESWK